VVVACFRDDAVFRLQFGLNLADKLLDSVNGMILVVFAVGEESPDMLCRLGRRRV